MCFSHWSCKVFFRSLPPAEKCYLGLAKPLEGPKTELWVSPSDQLLGRVVLRPPLTTKYIKALTHQGILEIGRQIELKRIDEAQHALEQAVADNEELMKFLAARQLEEALHNAKLRQEDREEELEKICKEKIDAALASLETKLRQEMAEAVQQERISCEKKMEDWKNTMVDSEKAIEDAKIQYQAELQENISILKKEFEDDLIKERSRCNRDMFLATNYRMETLRAQKHAMECTHVAELMCALCSERSRCAKTTAKIKDIYEQQVKMIEARFEELSKANVRTIIKPNEYYERRIRAIVKNFQKFINYALNAVPGQAEFLLSLEQLLMVQMSDTLLTETTAEVKKEEPELPYVPDPFQDDRKEFVKRIRDKRDKSYKPFLLYDDAMPGNLYQRLREEATLEPPYIVLGGHKYAEPKYYEKVRKLFEGVDWDVNYEEEEYAEEEVMEPDKTASAAVQTRDNWCSLDFIPVDSSITHNLSNVRFSLTPESLVKGVLDMSNLPEDTERIISTTDADSTATPDDHKDLPVEKEMESIKGPLSEEDLKKNEAHIDVSSKNPDTDRLSNSLELLQHLKQPNQVRRKSKLPETKNSVEIFKEKMSNFVPQILVTGGNVTAKRSSVNDKPLVRDSIDVASEKASPHLGVAQPVGIIRELSDMRIGKRLEPIDSLETEHSKLLLARASLSKDTKEIRHAEYIEKIPIGPIGSAKKFDEQEFGNELYVEQDRFQLGLGPAAAYMSPVKTVSPDITDNYEKCTEFEYKLLLYGLTKDDVKDIENVEKCDLKKVAEKKREAAKRKKTKEVDQTFILWNPYDTDLAEYQRDVYTKIRREETYFDNQNICPKMKKMLDKSIKQEKRVPVDISKQTQYCKYPHMFDLDKLAYDRIFGRTESVTDQALEFYKKLLADVPDQPMPEVQPQKKELNEIILDVSDENIRKVVEDLANGSNSHLHQKVIEALATSKYGQVRMRSLLNLIRKYPSLAKMFAKDGENHN